MPPVEACSFRLWCSELVDSVHHHLARQLHAALADVVSPTFGPLLDAILTPKRAVVLAANATR
jgi:hypothetical protein